MLDVDQWRVLWVDGTDAAVPLHGGCTCPAFFISRFKSRHFDLIGGGSHP